MSRTVFVSLGDRHSGLRNGLCPPDMELVYGAVTNQVWPGMSDQEIQNVLDDLDRRAVNISGWSDWLWHEVWLPGIEKVKEFAGSDPVVILDSGDMVHGSRFVESLYTPFVHHQVDIAVESMRPWRELKNLYGIAMVYGTGSHDYGANAAAKKVYDGLGPWGYKMWLGDHLKLKFGDFRIDLAHHGTNMSKRTHLRYNTIRLDFEQKIRTAKEFGEPTIDFYQRGHWHRPAWIPIYVDWAMDTIHSTSVITPPMTGPNGYARQATRSTSHVKCGFYAWELVDGKIGEVQKNIKRKDIRNHYEVEIPEGNNQSWSLFRKK